MNEVLTIDEKYSRAIHTSNLRMENDAQRSSPADILVAAGWSSSRMGAALLRLHSEWDGAGKPRKPTPEAIDALALTFPTSKDGQPVTIAERTAVARDTAGGWYLHEQRILMGKLKTLPGVRECLEHKASVLQTGDPVGISARVLLYWLDQNCQICGGRGERAVVGAPALSGRACHACHGTGLASCPGGADGRKLANWLDDCTQAARQSITQRLRSSMGRNRPTQARQALP